MGKIKILSLSILFFSLNLCSAVLAGIDSRIEKAEKYLREGSSDKAIQVADEILRKNSDALEAYSVKIKALINQKKYLSARETYDQLVGANSGDYPPALSALAWGIIVESFYDKSFFVRGSAALALGEIGDARMLTPLQSLLKDSFEIVRVRAVEAMGMLGQKEAAPILKNLVKDKNYLVRSAAVESLGKLEDYSHVSVVVEDLNHPSWNVRARAAEVLGRLGNSDSISNLRKKLRDENQYVRVRVAEALAKCGDTSVKSIFEETMKSGDWPDRVRSAQSLITFGEKTEAFETLALAMRQEDWKIRVQASEILGKTKDQEAAGILARHADDKRWEVQFAVAQALVDLGDSSAAANLRKLLDESDDGEVRANAASALGLVGNKNDFLKLRQALKDSDGRVKVQAAKAIIQIRRRTEQ